MSFRKTFLQGFFIYFCITFICLVIGSFIEHTAIFSLENWFLAFHNHILDHFSFLIIIINSNLFVFYIIANIIILMVTFIAVFYFGEEKRETFLSWALIVLIGTSILIFDVIFDEYAYLSGIIGLCIGGLVNIVLFGLVIIIFKKKTTT